MPNTDPEFDAIVLAGAGSARFGDGDKAMMRVGDDSLLERSVGAVAGARQIIVVGPRREMSVDVQWTEESPAGGGPANALAAGLAISASEIVVVLACDHPFVSSELVGRLIGAVGSADGAQVRDGGGRGQPLVAAYRSFALHSRLNGLRSPHASLRSALSGLKLAFVTDERAALDCDTQEDLAEARRLAAEL